MLGAAALLAQLVLLNCGTSACDTAIIDIGLAGGAALSALSQLALVVGLWLLWSSRRRAP